MCVCWPHPATWVRLTGASPNEKMSAFSQMRPPTKISGAALRPVHTLSVLRYRSSLPRPNLQREWSVPCECAAHGDGGAVCFVQHHHCKPCMPPDSVKALLRLRLCPCYKA